jgi:hypothetical protein
MGGAAMNGALQLDCGSRLGSLKSRPAQVRRGSPIQGRSHQRLSKCWRGGNPPIGRAAFETAKRMYAKDVLELDCKPLSKGVSIQQIYVTEPLV